MGAVELPSKKKKIIPKIKSIWKSLKQKPVYVFVIIFALLGAGSLLYSLAATDSLSGKISDNNPTGTHQISVGGSGEFKATVKDVGRKNSDSVRFRLKLIKDNQQLQSFEATRRGEPVVLTYMVEPGNYTIEVSSVDQLSKRGTNYIIDVSYPDPAPKPDPVDITPPVININSPVSGATVSGSITISGTAQDDTALKNVIYRFDGGSWQVATGTTNWSGLLDTTTQPNGQVTIQAQANDTANNTKLISITINVKNGGTEPPITSQVEGSAKFMTWAKSSFDVWSKNPTEQQKQFMRDNYYRMLVFSPYFDSRLSWYDRVFEYIDAYAIKPDWPEYKQHPEWILKDYDTNKQVYINYACSGGTCPQFAADISNPAYVSWFKSRIKEKVDIGYNGIFLDDVNLVWRFSNGTSSTKRILDPNTGQLLTLENWRKYFAEFTESIRKDFPNIEIVHNSIWYADQTAFNDPYVTRQINASNWVLIEHGANDGGLDASGSYGFKTLLSFIDRVHSQGKNIILNDDVGTTVAQAEHNLATYFLVNNGNDMVGSEIWEMINPDNYWEGYKISLGKAKGNRYDWNGFIRRDFEKGIVVVREPDIGSASFQVPDGYKRIDGSTPPSTITLQPQTSVILVAR